MRHLFINTLSRLGNYLAELSKETSGGRMLLADVLRSCNRERKTGLLNVAVVQSNRFLVKVYFMEGSICRLSFGPLHGKEFLECLDYYDLSAAVYLDGMKASRKTCLDISTEDVISIVMAMGKVVRLTQWIERR